MDWQPILDAAVKAATVILITMIGYAAQIVVAYVKQLRVKANDNEYARKALNAVEVGVNFASQTFVDALKAKGNFLETDWAEAMRICIDAAKAEMPAEVMDYIAMMHGDVEAWIKRNAEAILKKINTSPAKV